LQKKKEAEEAIYVEIDLNSTIRKKLSNHIRGKTIQKSKDRKMYHTRVTGIPKKEAQEIYDILEVKTIKNRIIKENSFHL